MTACAGFPAACIAMSKTHGPRMNRARTREVLDKLGIDVETSDGHGIVIRRAVSLAGANFQITETWRLYTGGGIAGNSDQVWLSRLPHSVEYLADLPALTGVKLRREDVPKRGPYWNKTQLEKALRAWRRGG